MTMKAFLDLLDRFGGDLAAWPPMARAQAQRYLAVSAEARQALNLMREAERFLGETRGDADWADLAVDVTHAAQAPQAAPVQPWRRGTRWAAAAAAAVLTVSLGVAAGAALHGGEDPSRVVSDALSIPGDPVNAT